MEHTPTMEWMTTEQDRRISTVVKAEGARLRNFIRKRVADEADAEDILQEVFYEFVQTYRLMKPIEQAGAWLFRVARNRIIDRFRKRRHDPLEEPLQSSPPLNEDGERLALDDFLPSPSAGPEAIYLRTLLIDALEDAIGELPEEQRIVFIAHEVEGRSFKELAEETGTNINTLLARKRYAVRHLRSRLLSIYDEFTKL
jgi:RNA polymerase sigma factor (sigma-70 family)